MRFILESKPDLAPKIRKSYSKQEVTSRNLTLSRWIIFSEKPWASIYGKLFLNFFYTERILRKQWFLDFGRNYSFLNSLNRNYFKREKEEIFTENTTSNHLKLLLGKCVFFKDKLRTTHFKSFKKTGFENLVFIFFCLFQ